MGMQARVIGTWAGLLGMGGALLGAGYALVVGYGAILGALIGCSVGAFIGVVSASRHRYAVSQLTNEITEEALGSAHSRTMYVMLPYAAAFKLTEEMLHLMLHTRIDHSDIERGELGAVIHIPAYRTTHVTNIWITLMVLDVTRTQVSIECIPRYDWLILPDYGRNLDIIQRITRFLESVSEITQQVR